MLLERWANRHKLKLSLFIFSLLVMVAIFLFSSMVEFTNTDGSLQRARRYFSIHSWDEEPLPKKHPVPKRVIYNRVGKCGSRTMIQLMTALAKKNDFTVVGSTRFKLLHISLKEQVEFVDFIDELGPPFIYHHHLHFVEFKRFGFAQPIYINLIRDPLARLVSAYYFKRFGDLRGGHGSWTFKGTEKERNQTFNECVLSGDPECTDTEKITYIIPHFCGQHSGCRKPTEWALRQAKYNVAYNYLVVGTLEELEHFLLVLETLLPQFFHGALETWRNPGKYLNDKMSTTRTAQKHALSPEVVAIMKERLKLEYQFYNFVNSYFHSILYDLGFHRNGTKNNFQLDQTQA